MREREEVNPKVGSVIYVKRKDEEERHDEEEDNTEEKMIRIGGEEV